MIRVTRLNGEPLVINAELIKLVEETPDTMITLTNNERIVVKETMDEVVQRAIQYARHVRTFSA
ncbi:MAG: flagellar FlbD family protein [Phycisphaerae bacterium]|nr:flagellar FlbD family protein [Phycisphaerae bacterium]NUQ47059.1 flagellar FlbD family protein [Phycisphaerae bacterium]